MNFQLFETNLTNPTILFFLLGMIAIWVKSDLEIPASSAKFISLYLLFSIGFKGGQELSHSEFTSEILFSILFGVVVALLIPSYVFFILKRKLSIYDSAALSAAFGSVSAVTFVAAMSYLEYCKLSPGGHMVAVMAMMEAPAIVIAVVLLKFFNRNEVSEKKVSLPGILKHSLTNGSVLIIIGSLLIGLISDSKQAEGIKPFTNDIFKGFLAIFLLEMGMLTAKRFSSFKKYGYFLIVIGMMIPFVNGCVVAIISSWVTDDVANRFIFSVLAASASYIAVPAAMRLAIPKADPGLYIPMALGVTFPFNITLGMPFYFYLVERF